MLKQFVKDSAIYGASGIITRGISLFLVPFYTRVFTPNDYGIIDLLGIVSAIVSSVFPLEITQAIARFYPDCKDEALSREYASTALYFSTVSFLVFLAVVELFAEPLSAVLFDGEITEEILRVAGLSIAAAGMFYFVQNQLRWRLEPARHATCSLLYSITAIGLTVFFVLVLGTGVVGVFWAQFIGSTLSFGLGFYYSRSSYRLSFNGQRLKEMLAFSGPIVPSSIGVLTLSYADRVSITSLMTLGDLGVFGIGYRVASAVTLVMMGFQGAISPLIYSRYREPGTPAEIARVFRYFVFGALLMATALSILGPEILRILTTPPYYGASSVIPFLVLSTFLYAMYVFAPGLGIAKKTKHIAAINLVGAAVNVALNLVLVRLWGIVGAATATLTASVVVFAAFMAMSQREYPVPHAGFTLLGSVGLALAVGLVGYSFTMPDLALSIAVKSLLLCILAGAFIGIKLIHPREIREYLRRLMPGVS